MRITNNIVIWVLLCLYGTEGIDNAKHNVRKFPDGFLFGCSTASYQIEGGWDADGKSENIWDYSIHNNPGSVIDQSNGDIAADSYNNYKRDVEIMRELGLDFYRFSLSWSRILPTGFTDDINEKGVQYYNNLIDEMIKYNIEPMVTLYHWDLPQKLQKLGGWSNPLITDWFADYAQVAFEKFGDRVNFWITLNEPDEFCHYGYGSTLLAPGLNSPGLAEYLCTKHALVSHAKAYHIYDKIYRPTQNGVIGISLSAVWYEPETNEDLDATEETRQFDLGQYSHPIFSKNGDFPPAIKTKIAAFNAAQGFKRSRLAEFSPDEISMLRGSSDFYGLNHYTTKIVSRNFTDEESSAPPYFDDRQVTVYQLDEWETATSEWLKVVPWGFYKLLTWLRNEYDNPPIIITENGYSTSGGLNDDARINYYKSYLNSMLDAVEEGSNVIAYATWSLMDNFEWGNGYTHRFGLYEVDFESPERTRTPRKSAFVYKEIVRTRALDVHYEPDTTVMTIDEEH